MEVRSRFLSVGVEKSEGVGVTLNESQVRGQLVKIDFSGHGSVNSSEINYQLAIDVNPSVIISGEFEFFSSLIGEFSMELQSPEIVVIVSSLITQQVVIQGEKGRATEDVDVGSIQQLKRNGKVVSRFSIRRSGVKP